MERYNGTNASPLDSSLTRNRQPRINPAQEEEEEKDYEAKRIYEQHKESIESRKTHREMRVHYADKAYRFAKYTLIGWAMLVFLFVLAVEPKPISDVALGIITTACTVNILVAFVAVIKGLFAIKDN